MLIFQYIYLTMPQLQRATIDAMTQDQNPPNEMKTPALCDACAGIQRNWRRAPGHPS